MNPVIDEDGDKTWFKNRKLHRDDGPAIEWADGSKEWYKNGYLHRDDGPAYEGVDGSKFWYKNGKRIFDLPAHYSLKILIEYGALTPIQIAKERLK